LLEDQPRGAPSDVYDSVGITWHALNPVIPWVASKMPQDSLKDSDVGYNFLTSAGDDTSQVAKAVNAKLAEEKQLVLAPPRNGEAGASS